MPRRRIRTVLCLAGLLLAPIAACGGGTGGVEEASDYLYSCPLQVINDTSARITGFEWLLVENRSDGDVLWDAQGRIPSEIIDPGMEVTVALGPSYADVTDPSRLEWRVTLTDESDTRYGPWILPLADCGTEAITVTPADAS